MSAYLKNYRNADSTAFEMLHLLSCWSSTGHPAAYWCRNDHAV